MNIVNIGKSGLGIGFGTQMPYGIREKKPFVQCAYDGLRPTAQLTNGSLASEGRGLGCGLTNDFDFCEERKKDGLEHVTNGGVRI